MHAAYPPPAELDLCRTPPRSTDNNHAVQPVTSPEAATSTSQPARRDLLLSTNLC